MDLKAALAAAALVFTTATASAERSAIKALSARVLEELSTANDVAG